MHDSQVLPSDDGAVSLKDIRVAILGCGTLGRSMLTSWLSVRDSTVTLEPHQISVTTGTAASLEQLKKEFSQLSITSNSNKQAAASANVIILCVKPNLADQVLGEIAPECRGKTVVSCCAGVSWSRIAKFLNYESASPYLIRAVPSVSSRFQCGITSLYSGSTGAGGCSKESIKHTTSRLFEDLGRVFWVKDESVLNVGIALGASSPAWLAIILEALADGAVAMGMPRSMAMDMAFHSMLGTATYMIRSNNSETELHPGQLKDIIATPGGCTIAGLVAMEKGAVRSGMIQAMIDCVQSLNARDAK